MNYNPIIDTDSYKASHYLQYPPGTTAVVGYLEARKGAEYHSTLWFGLQYILKEYFTKRITRGDVEEAAAFFKAHGLPFPKDGWMKVVKEYSGHPPLVIRSVPEGTLVPVGNVLMTVKCDDPDLFWLVNWFETKLMRVWYPSTVATKSFFCKKVIRQHLAETSDSPEQEIQFKLHDFGARGVSSAESALLGGMAHLVNFSGSDTCIGVYGANTYYGHSAEVAGYSIPAMEHSTVTSWGKDGEADAFANMIRANSGAMVACVSDSYDLYKAVEEIWGGSLLTTVQMSGKTVVIRPDSGDACQTNLEILRILESKVPFTFNSKGYKVLPSYFRLIQGDGNDDEKDIDRVLTCLKENGYSASNIAFGMGGGLLQKVNRDTQRFAFKVSLVRVNGVWRKVSKNPSTDPTKASKAGYLDLVKDASGEFRTISMDAPAYNAASELKEVYDGGCANLMRFETFDEVRQRAATY